MGFVAHDLGVDLGTSNTLVYVKHKGIMISEPTIVVVDAGNERKVRAVGDDAKIMLGRTTEDAMRSGVLYGHASMVDGMIGRMEEVAGQPVTVVATGGNAAKVLKYCTHNIIYDADLVMDGLYLLYQKNTEKRRK